jgi:hypothetical protein
MKKWIKILKHYVALKAGVSGDDSLLHRLLGLALVGTNLMFDGYTNSAQKGINDKYKTKE